MANITKFTFQGAINFNGSSQANFSFTPPSGAWAYKVTITDGSAFNYTVSYDYVHDDLWLQGVCFAYPSQEFVLGTTYTASIQYSTVAPPGTPVFSSTAVTTTFSLAASTAQITLDDIAEQPEQLNVKISSWPLASVTGTLNCTGPGFNQTVPVVTNVNGLDRFAFAVPQPGKLYTITATLPGLTTLSRTFFSPVGPNTFGTPTIGTTSVTLPWTLPVGATTVAASNCFTTCMLYNENNETWISTQIVATGSTQSVSISSLATNTQYQLYCWPVNAGGFGGKLFPGGDHSITFVTGGVSAVGSWGIRSFYSPPSN
jgi:hypothetical protein